MSEPKILELEQPNDKYFVASNKISEGSDGTTTKVIAKNITSKTK